MRGRKIGRSPRLAIVLLPLAVSAATDQKTEALLVELGKASAQVKTLQAQFVQEKHVAIVRDVLRSSGTFTLDKGGRIAWSVTEPEPLRVVIKKDGVFADGKRVVGGADNAAASASVLPMIEGMSGIFAGLSPKTAEAFDVERLADDKLRLKSRSPELARWIAAIEITLDPKQRTPTHIRLEEPGGDVTEITFRDVVLNPKLDDTAFAP